MTSEFLGYIDCHICESRKVRVTLGAKGVLTCTCNGMCKSQTFVRGDGGAMLIKARVRPVVAAMPVPPEGQEIKVPGVVKPANPEPEETPAPAPTPAPVEKKSFWSR